MSISSIKSTDIKNNISISQSIMSYKQTYSGVQLAGKHPMNKEEHREEWFIIFNITILGS